MHDIITKNVNMYKGKQKKKLPQQPQQMHAKRCFQYMLNSVRVILFSINAANIAMCIKLYSKMHGSGSFSIHF